MVLTKHRPRHDEAVLLDATVHTAPVVKPRGVPAQPLAGRPGIAADVLRELRAADAPLPPTALRAAFDRAAGTWLPVVGLRAVPLALVVVDDIDTVLADVAELHAALTDRQAARFAATLDMLTSWAAGLPALDTDWTAQLAEQLAEVTAR